eukprot:4120146-Prymnesium_polylepis.1
MHLAAAKGGVPHRSDAGLQGRGVEGSAAWYRAVPREVCHTDQTQGCRGVVWRGLGSREPVGGRVGCKEARGGAAGPVGSSSSVELRGRGSGWAVGSLLVEEVATRQRARHLARDKLFEAHRAARVVCGA